MSFQLLFSPFMLLIFSSWSDVHPFPPLSRPPSSLFSPASDWASSFDFLSSDFALESLEPEEEAFFLPHAAHFSHPPLDLSFFSPFDFSSVFSALEDLPRAESLSYAHIHVSILFPRPQ